MQFNLSPRDMLIARIQAYVYANVKQGDYPHASKAADSVLSRFDCTYDDKPTDSAAYWAGFYFDRFCEECQS